MKNPGSDNVTAVKRQPDPYKSVSITQQMPLLNNGKCLSTVAST